MFIQSTTAIVLSAVLACSSASAQSRDEKSDGSGLYIGVTGALSSNFHSGGFRMAGDSSAVFEGGNGAGSQIGLTARYQFTKQWAIDGRVVLDARPASFDFPTGALMLIPGTNGVVTMKISNRAEVEYELITSDLLITALKPLSDAVSASFTIGPSVGIVQLAKITKTQTLDSPDSARFMNNWDYPISADGRTIYFARGEDIASLNDLRISAKAGVGIDVDMLELVTLRAGIFYDYGLTDVTDSENWNVSSLSCQFDVLFAIH